MNYYPHHIGDFRSGTVNMSRLERWIYRDLIDVYYDTEKPLPLDIDAVCYAVGVSTDEERRVVANLLRFKFEQTDVGYIHERCEIEITAYRSRAETAQENGKKGGRPKKPKATQSGGKQYPSETQPKPNGFPSGSESVANGGPSETHSKGNQEPRTKNQEIKDSSNSIAVNARDTRFADDYVPLNETEWARFFGDEHGIDINPTDVNGRKKFIPLAKAWCNVRVSIRRMREAIERAQKEATETIVYLPAYVDRVLASMAPPRASPRHAENDAILAELTGNAQGHDHDHDFERDTIDVDARCVG